MPLIADAPQRQQALDPNRSFIVQAPAGSGKTELLIQRYMRLLGRVQQPQEVLALTFTRKAAAEMRHRVMGALRSAASEPEPDSGHHQQTWQIARQALNNSQQRGWNLLQNPTQLRILTLDSFNAGLVRRMPWLSRLGGMPPLTENSRPLYLKAAENLVATATRNASLKPQLTDVLEHLDNRLDHLAEMLADLLSRRDQWLGYLARGPIERRTLETAMASLTEKQLRDIDAHLTAEHREALFTLLHTADQSLVDEGKEGYPQWRKQACFPAPSVDRVEAWRELCRSLLTTGGSFRRKVTRNEGFPPGEDQARHAKEQMLSLLGMLATIPGLETALRDFSQTAAVAYSDRQWQILQALFELLPLAVLELWHVFRAQGEIDFAELALKAQQALQSGPHPTDLLQQLDQQVSHILVDEFQDTSHLQYRLLDLLTEGWTPTDGRTLFLVGDPMQSIYRFREAEVGLFLQAWQGRLGSVQLTPLQLVCNFRSQAGVVDWNNAAFAEAFPAAVDALRGAVPFALSQPVHPDQGSAVQILPAVNGTADAEAERVADLVERLRNQGDESIAILVRSRTHLPRILAALRQRRLPYQAQEIETLAERQVVLDLSSLVQAICHTGDNLSWLSVLRSPLCGLEVSDLLALTGDARIGCWLTFDVAQIPPSVSSAGQKRLQRILPILIDAGRRRGSMPLCRLVESVWLQLGGPACYAPADLEDAAVVLRLVQQLEQGGDLPSFARFQQELQRLFSTPDTSAGPQIQVMTIHKAKGLEFDHVILPGLGRMPRKDTNPLLRWLYDPEFKLMMAPVAPKDGGREPDPAYEAIRRVEKHRADHEQVRLLYVACTRAVRRLYLFAEASSSEGECKPTPSSFLALLWPMVASHFEASADEVPAPVATDEPTCNRLYRLPLAWALPPVADSPVPTGQRAVTASDSAPLGDLPFSGFETDVARHIGTEVHRLLERIAIEGLQQWDPVRIERQRSRLRFFLASWGVPANQLSDAVARIIAMVVSTTQSATGQWILQPHPAHVCEQPLTGFIDGQKVQAVVDRSFIDQGTRWVIDYKTSTTHGDIASFLAEETERYRPQMLNYCRLYQQMDPSVPIKGALYFPQLDRLMDLGIAIDKNTLPL